MRAWITVGCALIGWQVNPYLSKFWFILLALAFVFGVVMDVDEWARKADDWKSRNKYTEGKDKGSWK